MFTITKEFRNVDHLLYDENGEYRWTYQFVKRLGKEFNLTVEELFAIFIKSGVSSSTFKQFRARLNNNSMTDKEIYALGIMFNLNIKEIINLQNACYNRRRGANRYVSPR